MSKLGMQHHNKGKKSERCKSKAPGKTKHIQSTEQTIAEHVIAFRNVIRKKDKASVKVRYSHR